LVGDDLNRFEPPAISTLPNPLNSPVLHALSTFVAIWILSRWLSLPATEHPVVIRSAILQLGLVLALPLGASWIAGLSLAQVFKLRLTSIRNLLLTIGATPFLIVLLDGIKILQSPWTGEESKAVPRFLQATSPHDWITLILCLAIIPAFCEESLFRGYLLDRLAPRDQPWRSIMVSSVLFGLFHPDLQTVLPALAAGIFFAFVATRTESLMNPIISHLVVNAWAIIAANSRQLNADHLESCRGPLAFVLLAISLSGIVLFGRLLRRNSWRL
jgi:membrane protease YdiL (CAAX protease family)